MGSDIHIHVGKKTGDEWIPIALESSLLPDDRHYEVFGYIANVRNFEPQAKFPDRGLPQGSTAPFGEKEVYHSHTYFYYDEFLNLRCVPKSVKNSYFFVFFEHVLPRFLGNQYLTLEAKRDIRIVLAFSS